MNKEKTKLPEITLIGLTVKTNNEGDGAQIEVEKSVLGLVNILANFKLSQSGNFLDYKGQSE